MKKLLCVLLALVLALSLLVGCGGKKEEAPESDDTQNPVTVPVTSEFPQLSTPKEGDPIAVIETSEGTIKAVLYPEYAPLAVENFTTHAKNGYYKDMLFHRVVKDFVIQTGDPTGTGRGGDSALGEPFKCEFDPALHHFTGALGMAYAVQDQNKSQFYIVTGTDVPQSIITQMEAITDGSFPTEVIDQYKAVGGQPALDYRYSVFGQVIEGMDVVNEINKVKVDEDDRPTKDVQLISISIETYSAKADEKE